MSGKPQGWLPWRRSQDLPADVFAAAVGREPSGGEAGEALSELLRQDSGADGAQAAKISDRRSQLEAAVESGSTSVVALCDDEELASSLSQFIQGKGFGYGKDPVCRWFFDWYQSGWLEKQRFVARFLPEMAAVYLLQPAGCSPPEALQAVLMAVFEEDARTRRQPDLPDLNHPSVYHTPSQSKATAGGSCRVQVKELPPGVAALVAGSSPTPALISSLVPKQLEGAVRTWQRPELAAAALSQFFQMASGLTVTALATACCSIYTLAVQSCPWVLEAAAGHMAPSELERMVLVGSSTALNDACRLDIKGRLLEQMCLITGHCWYRVAGKPGSGGTPQQGSAPLPSSAKLLEMVRTTAAVLHARTTCDLDPSGELLTTSLIHIVASPTAV